MIIISDTSPLCYLILIDQTSSISIHFHILHLQYGFSQDILILSLIYCLTLISMSLFFGRNITGVLFLHF